MTIIGISRRDRRAGASGDSPRRAQEASLRADLFTFRSVLDQYKGDKGNYPPDLETLIKDGYIRRIPLDPITKKADWVLTMEEEPYRAGRTPSCSPCRASSTSTAPRRKRALGRDDVQRVVRMPTEAPGRKP
jgi:hypothetical protein